MSILAPAGEAELALMLDWALAAGRPVMIRYPKDICPAEIGAFRMPLEEGRGVFLSFDQETPGNVPVCLAFTGGLYAQAREAAEILGCRGMRPDLYNLRFLKPLDEDYLAEIMNRYKLFVVAEEGCRAGGFGEYATELAARRGCSCGVLILAAAEYRDSLGKREELLKMNGLDGEGISAALTDAGGGFRFSACGNNRERLSS